MKSNLYLFQPEILLTDGNIALEIVDQTEEGNLFAGHHTLSTSVPSTAPGSPLPDINHEQQGHQQSSLGTEQQQDTEQFLEQANQQDAQNDSSSRR